MVRRAGPRASSSTGQPVLDRAGVKVAPHRVAAVVPRAGGARARARRPRLAGAVAVAVDRGSLWAGLFDLRENLLGRALDDLRAIAA